MRALKFKINRQALNQIYISLLRPLLEYAAVVWDGCTDYGKLKLESGQLPDEFTKIIPDIIGSFSSYHFRNVENLSTICR
jgi:hypothetical protein